MCVDWRGPYLVSSCGALGLCWFAGPRGAGGGGRAGVRGPAGSGWRAWPAAGWQLRGPLVDRFVV